MSTKHVTHVSEACHTSTRHVTHVNEACHTCQGGMSHIPTRHVTHVNESFTHVRLVTDISLRYTTERENHVRHIAFVCVKSHLKCRRTESGIFTWIDLLNSNRLMILSTDFPYIQTALVSISILTYAHLRVCVRGCVRVCVCVCVYVCTRACAVRACIYKHAPIYMYTLIYTSAHRVWLSFSW